jgi:hypothetical protein
VNEHTQCTAFSINVINLIPFVRFVTNGSSMLLRYCHSYKYQQLIPDEVCIFVVSSVEWVWIGVNLSPLFFT